MHFESVMFASWNGEIGHILHINNYLLTLARKVLIYIRLDNTEWIGAMKSWYQMLHKIFDALAFANAGNLGALQRMLEQKEGSTKHGSGIIAETRPYVPANKITLRTEIIELRRPHQSAG